MLPDNETITFEDQLYVNPEASLKEQNAFIDNLRGLQNQNNAEINTQTYNLGTAVPSNLGGLTGGEGYFTSRLQTPQSTSLAANLRATAQAQALNEVLSNELAMQKQRYNKAYKAAQRRANTPTTPTTDPTKGDIGEKPNDKDKLKAQGIGSISRPNNVGAIFGGVANAVSRTRGGIKNTYTTTVGDDGHSYTTLNGKLVDTSNPNYRRADNGQMYYVGRNGTTKMANNSAQLEKIRAAAKAQGK